MEILFLNVICILIYKSRSKITKHLSDFASAVTQVAQIVYNEEHFFPKLFIPLLFHCTWPIWTSVLSNSLRSKLMFIHQNYSRIQDYRKHIHKTETLNVIDVKLLLILFKISSMKRKSPLCIVGWNMITIKTVVFQSFVLRWEAGRRHIASN